MSTKMEEKKTILVNHGDIKRIAEVAGVDRRVVSRALKGGNTNKKYYQIRTLALSMGGVLINP